MKRVTFESLDDFGKFLNWVFLLFVLILDFFEPLNLCLQIVVIRKVMLDFKVLLINVEVIIMEFLRGLLLVRLKLCWLRFGIDVLMGIFGWGLALLGGSLLWSVEQHLLILKVFVLLIDAVRQIAWFFGLMQIHVSVNFTDGILFLNYRNCDYRLN